MRKSIVPGLPAWVFLAFVVCDKSPARAELLYFANGGEAQVPATWVGSALRVDLPGRSFQFPGSEIRKIVPGYWPEQEWESRKTRAMAAGAEARFAAAWWALENGLTPQAQSMLREAHRADTRHQPTARMIVMLDRLARPVVDPDVSALQRALGGRCELARGPHVILVHQHGATDAAERLELLERVVMTYYLLLASQGIELSVPDRRMASTWFAEHDDYLEYLRSENLGVFRTTRGYYHPTLNAVMAYDGRSSGSQKQARQTLASRAAELQRLAASIDALPPRARLGFEVRGEPKILLTKTAARSRLEELRSDLERRELLLELDWRSVDLGTAAHEMVHQLVASSGLAPHHDDFPLWLHEGFAAQFEVIRGGRWSGIGRAHDIRLSDWRALQPAPLMAPLVNDHGFGRGYQRGPYAQAWSLVYFLRKEHPAQFVTFLDLLRSPDVDSARGKSRTSSVFQQAFETDPRTLETDWHRFLAATRTPLDEHRPREKQEPANLPKDRD